MSSGIGLDESKNDAEKGIADIEEQVLQKTSGTVDIVSQWQDNGEVSIQSLGHRVMLKNWQMKLRLPRLYCYVFLGH